MTTVPPVSSTTPPQTAQKSSVGTLDYNAFLKLLIAQLKNQDPTSPANSTAFVAQLATFSQVEQSINANSKLDSILSSSSLSLADTVIGHTITSPDGLTKGVVSSVKVSADGAVATLTDGRTMPLVTGIQIA